MKTFLILSFFLICNSVISQNLIRNGSFEGKAPFYDRIPEFWEVCNEVSSPDVQPISSDKGPFEGDAYLGLVARVRTPGRPEWNGTVEAIHQELTDSLIPGHEYHLQIHLMYDPNHKPSTPRIVGPAFVSFYLGNEACGEYSLIWQSDLIDHREWHQYDVFFKASCGNNFLRLESGIGDQTLDLNYIMIDHVSLQKISEGNDVKIDCEDLRNNPPPPPGTIEDLYRQCKIFTPNIFSPNKDGSNDNYKVFVDCLYTDFQMQIFDRWGNAIYFTKDMESGWDGSMNHSPAAPGIYLYKLIIKFINEDGENRSIIKTGQIALNR